MGDISVILGREEFKHHMDEVIIVNKVSHAYIFAGGPGIGKRTIADIFSKMLQCEEISEKIKNGSARAGSLSACGACHSCLQAASDSHPDIIHIKRQDGKKSISVEDIRTKLVNDAAVKPYSSAYKIYIIEDAQDLTPEAQNAMLKTLEEPPEYAVIILLTTREDALLQTIRSRCEIYDIPPVSKEVMRDYLKGNCLYSGDEDLNFAVAFADGNIGKGIAALNDSEFTKLKEDVIYALLNVKGMSVNGIMKCIRDAYGYRDTYIDYYFDLMSLWYRDVLLFETTRDANGVIFKSYISDIDKQAQKISYDGIDAIMEAIDKARIRLRANVSFEIAMQMLFITIKENIKG